MNSRRASHRSQARGRTWPWSSPWLCQAPSPDRVGYFSVGYPVTEPVRQAIRALPEQVWHPALGQDGPLRQGVEVAELTGMIVLAGYPEGTRGIVRRERPHPGAQLSLFDLGEGMRHEVFLTDTPYGEGSLQHLEVRHHAHARVEDRIRSGKTTGFGRFPSRHFQINAAWLELALTSADMLVWAQTLLLEGELATAEPKNSATGCCTQLPASPAALAASACASPQPGPGETS